MCILEDCVYFYFQMEYSIKKLIKFIWSNVKFKAYAPLLIFCQDDLSIDVSGMLKSPTIIVLLLIFPFFFFFGCWYLPYILKCSYLGAYIFIIVYLLRLIPWLLLSVIPCLCNSLSFKFCFVQYEQCSSSFHLISVCMEYLLQYPHFQSVCVPRSEMGLW